MDFLVFIVIFEIRMTMTNFLYVYYGKDKIIQVSQVKNNSVTT